MSGFTPGPWKIIEKDDEPYPMVTIAGFSSAPVLTSLGLDQYINGADDCELEPCGEIEIATIDMDDEPFDERVLNACLICSAPDLYSALEMLLDEARRVNWASKFNGDVGILEVAETALRRARGEE